MPGTSRPDAPLPSRWSRALTGVVSAAAGIGVAHTVAALTVPAASPLLAVGSVAIDAAPTPVKEFAVATFGTADKPVLLGGMAVVLLAVTALIGVHAFRRRWIGIAGMAALGVVAGAAALARLTEPLAVLPAAVAAVVAVLVLRTVVAGLASRTAGEGEDSDPGSGPDPESPLAGTHVRAGRFVPTRRGVLLGGPAALAVAGVGGGIALGLRTSNASIGRDIALPEPADPAAALPEGVQLDVAGITPFRTASADFYRVDIALSTPRLDANTWTLRIGGMVDEEITLTYADILEMPMVERWITICCVSNPVGGPYASTGRWLGVPLADVLERVGVSPDANQIYTTSADGLTMSIPLDVATDGRDALLAIGLNGEQLPIERGFPARLIVPGLFGYVSAAKWITDMKLSTYDEDEAYWTERGWAIDGPVLTQTRIDLPAALERVPSGTVTIAGVAWAQHRGIEKVEVKIDDGDWTEADLGDDGGDDLWRLWRFDWESTGAGRHDVTVRSTDRTGDVQTDERTDPFPDGSRGQQSIPFMVED